jgi:hypothetical protein
VTIVDSSQAVRCATWARSVALDPGGTAGRPNGFLVVDRPLPWPRDIGEIDGLGDVVALAREHGLRVQGRVPTLGQAEHITLYRRAPEGPFRGYFGEDVDAAADLAAALARPPRSVDHPGEVLVCTHGRRDTCCGSAGTTLFASLTGAARSVSGATVAGRTVNRTSHTGGHRFAPTVIVLPEGTAWAFADADLVERVVTRSGPLKDVVPRYRGCTGLSSPALQCLERAVLGEMGWSLLASARTGEMLDGDGVRLSVLDPDGEQSVWEAEVVAGRTVTVPDCGGALEDARKTETERVVRALRRVR